ncbi:MAG: hypothetical protein D6765_07295, partial [Bacteroidetes bacterium]
QDLERIRSAHSSGDWALRPGAEGYTLAQVLGLEIETFPPLEALSPEQMDTLSNALAPTFLHFGFDILLPEGLPEPYRYWALRHCLRLRLSPFHLPPLTVEPCGCNPRRCPFPADRCHCPDLPANCLEPGADPYTEAAQWIAHQWNVEKEALEHPGDYSLNLHLYLPELKAYFRKMNRSIKGDTH